MEKMRLRLARSKSRRPTLDGALTAFRVDDYPSPVLRLARVRSAREMVEDAWNEVGKYLRYAMDQRR